MGRWSCRTGRKKAHGRAEEIQAQEPTDQLYRGRKGKLRCQGRKKVGRSSCTVSGDSSCNSVRGRASLQDFAWKNSDGFGPGFTTYSRQVAHSLSLRVRIMNDTVSRGNVNILWSHDSDLEMAIRGVKAKVLW